MSSSDENRLTRLEESSAFQEATLEGLHETLLMQQRQMDELERRLKTAEQCLRDMRESLSRDGGENTGPPPHYQSLA